MPYSFEWLIENRLIYERIYGDVTLEELREVTQEGARWIDAGNAPVHSLIDLTELKSYPTNLKDLVPVVNMKAGPKSGWVLVVTSSQMARFLISVLSQLSHQRINAFLELRAAMLFLSARDSTVDSAILPQRDGNKAVDGKSMGSKALGG